MRMEDGEAVNLTTLHLTAHCGSHADAYFHYEANGTHPAGMPINAYIGPVHLVTVQKIDGPLYPADFDHVNLDHIERLLIHSHVSDLSDQEWAEKFPYLSTDLIAWLAAKGCLLIGLDSPSVDDFNSKDLPCHHSLYNHGIVNLESLYLRDVPDGQYELIALPLKLDAACGSPVRAILRTLQGE